MVLEAVGFDNGVIVGGVHRNVKTAVLLALRKWDLLCRSCLFLHGRPAPSGHVTLIM